MSNSANVHSSEAINAVRAGVLSFIDEITDTIVTLELEMRRVVEWVEHDRPRHWKNQSRQAIERLNEAQAELRKCLMYPKTVNDRPTCYEERQAVSVAQARLDYCQRKIERVSHWKRTLPREIAEYKGRISRLKRLVEFELPTAVGTLDKILLHLQEYSAIRVDPAQKVYNELSLVRELWPDNDQPAGAAEGTETTTAGAVDLVSDPAAESGPSAQEQ